ncbi:uncharacterized protein BDV14DRAFT_180589 [Aspergillus stella-maris]|uniref:uncharacterized protein n=1 Tax=Aspergillus stella-maris TaxID=1810926 RepID=UPI003CCCC353
MPTFKHQRQRQKYHSFHPPPLFWDKLPKLWLTKSALREANRRNKSLSSYQRSSSIPYTFAPDFLRNCSTTPLKEVKRFSRCGGPDLSDIRDYPAPAHFCQYSMDPTNSKRHTQKRNRATTKGTTAYDPHFEQHLMDWGVLTPLSTYPDGTKPSEPKNLEEIRERLQTPRPLADSDVNFNEFDELNKNAVSEQLVITDILPVLEGKRKRGSMTGGGQPFNNLDHLTNGTLVQAKPDLYHGARPNQLNYSIREKLEKKIIPTSHTQLPITPNFFVEAKGHGGSTDVVQRQACYNAALGARGMHALQQYRHESCSNKPNYYDNNAYTIAATFQNGQLGLYVAHPTTPMNNNGPAHDTDYVMTKVGKWSLDGDSKTYLRGITAYRNAQDLAREFRDDFIRQANEQCAPGQVNASSSDRSEETSKS